MALLLALLSLRVQAQPPVLIGFDGAYGVRGATSALSIERGARVAMAQINAAGGVLGGRQLELVKRDNRSVPARGIANMRELAAMPDLVAVLGGRFSPVMLESLPVLHELQLPLLDAWGSADGITRHDFRPSYSFRLSLRDSLGMPVMLGSARAKGATRIGLLVPNSGWGRSNHRAALAWLEAHPELQLVGPLWYNLGERNMLRHYSQLLEQGAESIVLVANDAEGANLLLQLTAAPGVERVPIISHWGVTGGSMFAQAGNALRELDFTVVQTFSFFKVPRERLDPVMARARSMFRIKGPEQIEAPVGFAQAYDLVHLLARAIDLAGTTDRPAVRNALEEVRDYQGLTGDYPRPFTPDRHDAMRPEQVFMARYRDDGVIIPLDAAVP